MTGSRRSIAVGILATLAGGSGCRSSPAPEALFAEAEGLRLQYEKTASHRAIAKYREAQAAWTRKGDASRAATAGERIGTIYAELGAPREALQEYQSALALAQKAEDRRLESDLRTGLGLAQALVAEREATFDEARKQCTAALELARESRAERQEARALNCLGEVAYDRQQPEQALAFHRDAERLWERLGDEPGRIETLRLMGAVHSDLSDLDAAESCYQRALSLSTSGADKRQRAIALVLDARLKARRGEQQKALDEFEAALALIEPTGDAVWEASALTGVAVVLRDMGQAGASLKGWGRALQLFETAGLKNITVDVLMSLGEAYLALGRDAEALSTFERARDLAGKLEIQRWKAYALRYIGVVQLFRHAPDKALEYSSNSLREQQGIDDDRLRARTFADFGEAQVQLRRPDRAVKDFDRALALASVAGDRVARARALFGLARSATGRNNLDAARRYAEESLEVIESIRTEVDNRELRISYAGSTYHHNEFLIDVLMQLDQRRPREDLAAAAFEACERARARSLLDSLREAGVDLRQGVDPELLKREQALRVAFSNWEERHRRLGSTRKAAALAEEYRELEHGHEQVQAEIRSRSPRYAALAQPQPLSLAQVRSQVLDADTLLLEYALGEERSYLWAVSAAGYTSHVLPPQARIEALAKRIHDRLTARLRVTGAPGERRRAAEEADEAYWKEAAELSEMLLGPVAKTLDGKRLLVVADGALQYVPFAALPEPGGRELGVPLANGHEVVGLPSASVLAVLRQGTHGRPESSGAIAVLADPVFEHDDPRLRAASGPGGAPLSVEPGRREFPRLAASRQEAAGIVASAPGGATLLATGFRASRATATSPQLGRYRIVHFATHGIFDDAHPEDSGVVLSMFDERGKPRDGFLRLHDVYQLELPVDLVVLSACDTALGRQVRGEGLVGMVRGFIHAGARRVVASLWKVDDEATGELMKTFYRGMLQEGRTPADALRQAQLGLWRNRRWHAPYYWAAFVLQGEPR